MRRRFAWVAVIVLASVISAILFYEPRENPKSNVEMGTVNLQVLLSPICPVERNPPDPACAPKPYKTTITILKALTNTPYKNYMTDASGKLTFSIDAGAYVLHSESTSSLPYCTDLKIEVRAKRTQGLVMNCDTGIR